MTTKIDCNCHNCSLKKSIAKPSLASLVVAMKSPIKTILYIARLSSFLMISWESEKILIWMIEFLTFWWDFLNNFKLNHEKFWRFNENFSHSHQPHENMRKGGDRAIFIVKTIDVLLSHSCKKNFNNNMPNSKAKQGGFFTTQWSSQYLSLC